MKSLFKRITSMLLAVSMMLSLGISMPKEINRTAEAATQNVANGMYYIKNSYSETYLEASGLARTKAQEGTDASLRQIWKITHVTDGYYSIRPLSNLETCLTVNYPSVSVGECSTADTSSALGIEEMWWFDGDADYCKIKPYFSSFRTYPIGLSGSHDGANLMFNAGSSFDYWELEAVSNRSGIYINGIETNNASTGTMWASLNVSKAVEAYAYSPTSNETAVTWTSSNTSIVTIDSDGVMTPHAVGTATIEATSTVNPSIKKTITLKVSEFSEGTYYLRNFASNTKFAKTGASGGNAQCATKSTTVLDESKPYMWQFAIQDDGTYTIRSVTTGLYLSVYNNSSTADTNILMSAYTGASGQKWSVISLLDGTYQIKAKCVGDADVYLGVSVDGTYLVNEENLSDEQKWDIIKTDFAITHYYVSDFSATKVGYIETVMNKLNAVYQSEIGMNIRFAIRSIQEDDFTGADDCLLNGPCDDSCNTDCSLHHKNILRIREEMLDLERDFNHFNVLWIDDAKDNYCYYDAIWSGEEVHYVNDVDFTSISECFEPIIIFMADNSISTEAEYVKYMTYLTLYDMSFLLGISSSDTAFAAHDIDCIREEYSKDCVDDVYMNLLRNPSFVYCDDCVAILEEYLGKIYERNN